MPDLALDPGALRHRLAWQPLDQSQLDAMNQPKKSWTTRGTYWGRVEPLAGRELMNARQLKAETTHKITMRNVAAVNAGDRFLFEGTGRVFNVESVFRQSERNAYLVVHCTEQKLPAPR